MKKLFTSDKFFLAMEIIACFSGIVYAVISAFTNVFTIEDTITLGITTICTFALFSAYRKHSKNAMKALMGALLGIQVVMNTYGITSYGEKLDRVFALIYLVLTIAILITHLVINSDHHSNPVFIQLNQILLVILVLVGLVWDITWLNFCKNTIDVLFLLLSFLACSTRCAVIVCVESRLDAYRLDREAAGWTEEKGYPEGYVHEFEKKDNK